MAGHSGPRIAKTDISLQLDAGNSKAFKFRTRLYDYGLWADGQTGSVGNFSATGPNNRRIIGTDPWGNPAVVWETYSTAVLNEGGGIYMNALPIDNTKLYRMSWWEKRITNSTATNCMYYAGMNGYGTVNGVNYKHTGTITTNPYFWYTSGLPTVAQLPANEWQLIVGHIWPTGSAVGAAHSDSGRYKVNGRYGDISYDFIWLPQTTTARSRTLSVYYPNVTGVIHHSFRPRFDLCDGTEPTIDDLLTGAEDKLSGLEKTAVLVNGAGYTSDKLGSIEFNGMDESMLIDSTVSGTGTKTISFWIKPDAITDDIRILSNQSNTNFSIRFYGGNLQVWGNSWVTVCAAGAAGVWTNYSIVLSGTTVKGYKDGVFGSSGTTTFNLSSLRFGYPLNGANGTHYDGLLSRFTVHNRVLSNSQILQNYNAFKSRYT
jgi:hypothetical protein